MRIEARNIQLRNLTQLAQVTVGAVTYMGALDAVAKRGLTIDLVVGGHELTTLPEHPIEIRRSPMLDALVEMTFLHEDTADLLEEVANA